MNYWTNCQTRAKEIFVRPLHHPAARDISVEGILYALADPVRMRIFAAIQGADCPRICSNFLVVDRKELPKSTLSQHFKILREAGLIWSERKGVEMHNTTRCDELKERFGPMIRAILNAYLQKNKRHRNRRA
jgi:DNA-binding transcriptional ArsR family regulator